MAFYEEEPVDQYGLSPSSPVRRLILPDEDDREADLSLNSANKVEVPSTPSKQPKRRLKKKKCGKGGCKGWCWPFVIYLILSVITIIFFLFSKQGVGATITYVLLQLIWIIIMGFIIYWLCKSGKTGWAWFLLFLPLIIQITWVVLAAIF